jgi:hypothetical protein
VVGGVERCPTFRFPSLVSRIPAASETHWSKRRDAMPSVSSILTIAHGPSMF